MPHRSQDRAREHHGYRPPITNILPDTASIAAVGAVGRTVATMSVVGGAIPITYTIVNAAGLAIVVVNNLLKTSADPVGTIGAKTVSIMAIDYFGNTKTETITVTVT